MTNVVKQYLHQDLNDEEKKSYLRYRKGNTEYYDWIEKVSQRRDYILLKEPKCECGEWIHISEEGECRCINKHDCCNVIIGIIS